MRCFWKKVTEEQGPGARRSWERINTLCSHLKTRFKRNLDQNMLKMLYFQEKMEKSPQHWEFRPQTPVGLRGWGFRPQLLLPSLASVTSKLRPIISYLSDSLCAP